MYFIANGLGDSLDSPSETQMRRFLDAVDFSDEEHGAAWLTDEFENSLELNGEGRLVFSLGAGRLTRHMMGVSNETAVKLWVKLAEGRIEELEGEQWSTGLAPPLAPEEAERRKREHERRQFEEDRAFYDLIGPELAGQPCREPGCLRNRASLTGLCPPHHFEAIRRRPCPF
jgi:hypothetical protein